MRYSNKATRLGLAFGTAALMSACIMAVHSEDKQPETQAAATSSESPSFRLKKLSRPPAEKPQKKEEPQSEALKNLTLLYDLYQSLSQSPVFSRLRM